MIVVATKAKIWCQSTDGLSDLAKHAVQKLRDDVTAGVGHPANRPKMIENVKVVVARYRLAHGKELLSQCSGSVALFAPLLTAPNKLLGARD